MPLKCKLVVTVPVSNANAVREAMGKAGAGVFGNYSYCSFSVRGVGRFKPELGAKPYIGHVGKLEEVEEERIEVTCTAKVLPAVIAAMKKVHQYEEVAYDVFHLETF